MGGNVFLENVSPRPFGAPSEPGVSASHEESRPGLCRLGKAGKAQFLTAIFPRIRVGAPTAKRRDFRRRRISMFLHPIHTDDKGLGLLVFVIAPAAFLLC